MSRNTTPRHSHVETQTNNYVPKTIIKLIVCLTWVVKAHGLWHIAAADDLLANTHESKEGPGRNYTHAYTYDHTGESVSFYCCTNDTHAMLPRPVCRSSRWIGRAALPRWNCRDRGCQWRETLATDFAWGVSTRAWTQCGSGACRDVVLWWFVCRS